MGVQFRPTQPNNQDASFWQPLENCFGKLSIGHGLKIKVLVPYLPITLFHFRQRIFSLKANLYDLFAVEDLRY